MAALKYVEPYQGFKNYGGLKPAWIGLKAKLAPNSIGPGANWACCSTRRN